MNDAIDKRNAGLPRKMLKALLILVPLCILIVDTTRPFRSTFRDIYNIHDLEDQFFYAASCLDIPGMERLLSVGVDVNAGGAFALKLAGMKSDINTRAVEYLIARGADVNARDWSGRTPLYDANDVVYASVLLKNGARVDTRDNSMRTPLHDIQNVEVAQLLIESGADVNALDRHGYTPLCLCCAVLDAFPWNPWVLDVVKVLIANGADVNGKGDGAPTPLTLAVEGGNVALVELLISKGAKVNPEGSNIWTPLNFAADFGQTQVAQLLISKGANIEVRDSAGRTAMHYASMEYVGRPKAAVITLLLSKGAQVNPVDREGKTPLDYATSDELKALLRKHGAKSGRELK